MAASRTCATWIWLTADIVTSGTETDKFIAFAEANTINRLYIHVDPTISSTVFQSFVAKCSSAEPAITVEALMGDPSWILQTNPSSMTDRLQWVQDYQTSVATNTALQIKGLHLDVEPWNLDGWSTQQADYIQRWQSLMSSFKSWANAQSPPLPVAADLPFWLNTLVDSAGKRLDLSMLDILDGAVFMTYRNTPQALMDIAQPALQAADGCGGKYITLAVETVQNNETPTLSYYGMGGKLLSSDLGSMDAMAIQWFGGLAVHDYHAWSVMQ